MRENGLLEKQYGFVSYYGSEKREGWLLNYITVTNRDGTMKTNLYLIDEKCINFLVTVPYFPSFLLKTSDCNYVDEYMKKKYASDIKSVEKAIRIDFKEYNHLNKPPSEFLKIRFKTESGFTTAMRDIKRIIAKNKACRNDDADYNDFLEENRGLNVEDSLLSIGEYDIPVEISVANSLKIRAGKWYSFYYTGESYIIEKSRKIVFPDLRILAFDIETFKKPLKFPNADFDEVMMISIKTESYGELIVNRKLVSKDIESFEYSPRDDMQCSFSITNEDNEENLLIRFIEIVQKHKPHLITTFNGAFFDFPFLEKRLLKYGISLEETIGFTCIEGYYSSSFIVHLDCYKWVKRDSYLPVGSQGLKAVTKIKLGYFPDDIDPEDMVELAITDPDKMASYSVSDAVATYFLYLKYVQPHVFSICSLIPLPPISVLCQGSGTLCEALLISEAVNYNAFIPKKRKESHLQEYNGHIAESMTYVGGYVECLKSGIFRSDFEYDFRIDEGFIGVLIKNLDDMLSEYKSEEDFDKVKESILKNLQANAGNIRKDGRIYHLDVGAMYPNIILTNKLQPISIVDDDICIRCDFSDDSNACKRRMEWILKAEYLPPTREEVGMIKNQLHKELFKEEAKDLGGVRKICGNMGAKRLFGELPLDKQNNILKSRVKEYSRNIYKKLKSKENSFQTSTVCQREVPFYVETVRKFRNQRYTYKKLHSDASKAFEKAVTYEEKIHAKKSVIIYSSLQVAHKCVLNSFYGYVMRKSSRWYSMEMAAIVCNIGGNIIRKAKEAIDKIGISLELDTDGIWCIIPESFISSYTFSSGRKISFLAEILNYFVCRDFTNYQYQEKVEGKYVTRTENSIFFEIDGPYRAMLLPASTEESKLLKKRYAIINDDNTIAELKGFEIKRRGELEIVKKFQEELFLHFLDGNTLGECYESLSEVCNYWLDILRSKGEYLDDDTIMELLSESRSMSKDLSEYAGKKSNITTTAHRMSEFLGKNILEEKLRCEYIVSPYPENKSIADRTIPVMIFRSKDRDKFLERWIGRSYSGDIRTIIDWDYYKSRLECVIQKMVILPALSQGIKNPLEDVHIPPWALRQKIGLAEFKFKKVKDIEDIINDNLISRDGSKTKTVKNINSFSENINKKSCNVNDSKEIPIQNVSKEIITEDNPKESENYVNREECIDLPNIDLVRYINTKKSVWMEKMRSFEAKSDIIKLSYTDHGDINIYYANNVEPAKKVSSKRTIYMQPNNWMYFEESKGMQKVRLYLPESEEPTEIATISLNEHEFIMKYPLYKKFFSHLSIRKIFEDKMPICYSNVIESNGLSIDYIIITSFIFQGGLVYVISVNNSITFIPGKQNNLYEIKKYVFKNIDRSRIIAINTEDPNITSLRKLFENFHILEVQIKVYASLDKYEELCCKQNKLHHEMEKEVNLLIDTSKYTRIPILNISEEVLDILLYRETKASYTICDTTKARKHYYRAGIKVERFISGFYENYSIEFECIGTLILSIIEYEAFLGKDTLFEGIKRKDFTILRSFLKKLVLDSVKGIKGTKILLRNIVSWIKKDSKIISEDLRDVCLLLQHKYVMHLVRRLKEHDYRIISMGKDIISIYTGKISEDSADTFFEHLSKRILALPGYELMKTRMIRKFQKLAFIDPNSYFFVENGEYFCFSMFNVPMIFLKNYFENDHIDHELVYRIISQIPTDSAKLILELISLRSNTQSLKSNCYKLIHLNEFEIKENNTLALDVVCPTCKTENILRFKCIRCYASYPREIVLEVAVVHLKHVLWLELMGDSYCDKCGGTNEMKLSDFCKCGGSFKKKRYWNEINKLKEIANNKTFDHLCDMISDHFVKC